MTTKAGRKDNHKQCEKCECLILPDGSDQKCTKTKSNKEKNVYDSSGDGDESSGEGIVISPKCHETIKIYVKGGPCLDRDESSLEKDIWTIPNSDTGDDTTSRAEPTPQVKPSSQTKPAPSEPSGTPSKTTQTADEEPPPKKKNVCFRLCRKKKPAEKENKKGDDKKKDQGKKTDKCHKDCNTQMCPSGPKAGKLGDDLEQIGDFLKTCPKCKSCGKAGGGGCNTNTIIFPRDQCGGDGVIANLENMLRLEAKTNSRNVEDIMSELHRQRREIHEVKDMLEMLMRAMREQLFMSAFGKGKTHMLDDSYKTNNLERKSNTLSMKSEEKFEKVKMAQNTATPPPPPPPPQEKKKKRFFPWCQ